jgi:hypothetical protein
MGISAVGIELEGLWTERSRDKAVISRQKINWQSDGSVCLGNPDITGEEYPKGHLESHHLKLSKEQGIIRLPTALLGSRWSHQGEVTSMPLNPSPEKINGWLESAYPAAVNQTCGLHLHLSFSTLGYYYRTVSQSYFDGVYDHFHAWGKEKKIKNQEFWERLIGNNQFCRKLYVPDKQVWDRGKNSARYCGINYCYSRYKTIEIRLLPMFKQWELAADAVNSFIAFTNKFLISSKLVAINEEINEQLPNFENKVEKLEIKKALLQVSNGETIEPISLIRASSPERVANAREQLRRQVLAALGPQRS